jgi:hypothetical protein
VDKDQTVTTKFNLRTITTPLLVTMLKTEMRFPKLFIFRCALTVGQFKKRIDPRFPKDFIDLTALPLWVYINLKKRIGQRRAFEVMRVAILTGGVAQQSLLFDSVNTERTFDNLINKELEINKIGTTRWNTLNVVERSDRRFEIKITRCMYHELAVSLGMPELTPIICQVDNAIFNAYLPDEVQFYRGGPHRRIADGASECNFIWEKQ